MGTQWVRAQVKRNEMQDAVDSILRWVSQNRQTAAISAAAAAGVIVFAGILLYSYRSKQAAAWDDFAVAAGTAYQGQTEAALKKIDELNARYPSSAASGYGLLFAGDLLYHRDRYPESLKYYKLLVDRGQPRVLAPFALGAQTVAMEAEGKCSEAVPAGEKFLAAFPDHFLAPQVHASVARCQTSLGQTDTAKITLRKISLQYPDTSWAAWAQDRLKALGGGA